MFDFITAAVVIAAAKTVAIFLVLLVTTLLVIWMERKVIADMQARVGPNRWGPFGLLQTLADGIKLFFKEDFRPSTADKWTYAPPPTSPLGPPSLPSPSFPWGATTPEAVPKTGRTIAASNTVLPNSPAMARPASTG